jgi:hypothetical protein
MVDNFLSVKEYFQSYYDYRNNPHEATWEHSEQYAIIYFIVNYHDKKEENYPTSFSYLKHLAIGSLRKKYDRAKGKDKSVYFSSVDSIQQTFDENYDAYYLVIEHYNLNEDKFFDLNLSNASENKPLFSQKVDKNELLKVHNEKFYYNDETSCYVFFLKSLKGVYTIHENDLKSIKSRYSNWDGTPSTLNQIARDFSLPRNALVEIKTQMGWTHDSDPFLDNELLENDVDSLTEEILQSKRRAVYEQFQRKEWDEVKRDAQKFREMDHSVIKPMMQAMSDLLPKFKKTPIKLNSGKVLEKRCMVVPVMDIHVGKLPFYMRGAYSYEQFHQECMKTFERLMEKSMALGKPDQIVSIAGSDWFHVDNIKHSTSELTSQAGQMMNNYHEMVIRGYKLAFEMFDFLVDLDIPVKVYEVDGNHDRMLSLNLALALEQRYRNEKHFSIDISPDNRKYHVYENNLFSFLHGDFLTRNPTKRQNTIMGNILNDTRRLGINTLSVDNFVVFSGHVHKQSASFDEDKGILDIVVPSLSVTDMWHHEHSYEGNKRCVSTYSFSPDGRDSQIITIGV